MSDDLLERALNAYHAEYHRHWRDGGDAQDHDEAHESAIGAVLELVGALSPSCVRQHDADGRPLCFTCGRTQGEHEGGTECAGPVVDPLVAERDRLRGALVDAERGPNGGIVVPVAPCGRISDEWCDPYESCCRRSGPAEKVEMWPASFSTPAGPRDNVGGLDGVGAERARLLEALDALVQLNAAPRSLTGEELF